MSNRTKDLVSSLVWLLVTVSVGLGAAIDIATGFRVHPGYWDILGAIIVGFALGAAAGAVAFLITRGIFALATRLRAL